VVEACMARLQEQALHAGIEATTSLQFGMPGPLSHCPPFGKTQAGSHMTCEHPLAAHALHMLGSGVDFCAGAERQTKCLVSVKKDAFAFATNTHCILALPVLGFLTADMRCLARSCTVNLLCPLPFVLLTLCCFGRMHCCSLPKRDSKVQKGLCELQKGLVNCKKLV